MLATRTQLLEGKLHLYTCRCFCRISQLLQGKGIESNLHFDCFCVILIFLEGKVIEGAVKQLKR